jgi:hypothetical protein
MTSLDGFMFSLFSVREMSYTHCNWQDQYDQGVPVQQLQIEIE